MIIRVAMRKHLPEEAFALFSPDVILAMQTAFNEACRAVDGAVGDGAEANLRREVIALRIIQSAQDGIRDPAKPRDDAVAHVPGNGKTAA